MLPLPQKFDLNEWCLLICIILAFTIFFWLPKRYPFSITILLLLFGPTVARLMDHLLAFAKLDLYNLMDGPKFELFDLFTYLLYAPFSYFFIYFYDRWNIRGYWIVVYILLFSSGGAFFEWILKVCHIFLYKGWILGYSFNVYFVIQTVELLFYYTVRRAYMSLTIK